MFAALLASPKLIIGGVIALIIVVILIVFFYMRSEINSLRAQVTTQTVQVGEDNATITALKNQLVLENQLNQNFAQAVNQIQAKEDATIQALNSFNIKVQAIKDPTGTATYITSQVNSIFHNLNGISNPTATKAPLNHKLTLRKRHHEIHHHTP